MVGITSIEATKICCSTLPDYRIKMTMKLHSTGLLIPIKPATTVWVSQANPIVLLFWQKDQNHLRKLMPARS